MVLHSADYIKPLPDLVSSYIFFMFGGSFLTKLSSSLIPELMSLSTIALIAGTTRNQALFSF
jgi:hypothetical protein